MQAVNLYNLQKLTLLEKQKQLQHLTIAKNEADLMAQKNETEKKQADFSKRSNVVDKEFDITADNLAFDDKTGFGQALGNAIYRSRDSANKTTIIANDIKFNRKTSSFLATVKPLMILEQNKDSIFIAADTLYSSKLTELRKTRQVPEIRDSVAIKNAITNKKNNKDSSANRFFEAYFHVRIFSDSLQAVGDSMFYSLEDSAFRLFKQPVVWADNNQVTGYTI